MTDFLSTLIRWTIRLVLLAMGLVFAVSLLCAAAVLAAFWAVRRLWARLTGRPVPAWVFKVDLRDGLNRFYRTADAWPRPPAAGPRADASAEAPADAAAPGPAAGRLSDAGDWRGKRPRDVTDVEPK